MNIKETIRAEIERRFWDYGTPLHDDAVTKKVDEILDIIDKTLPEQPVEGLEEELEKMWRKTSKRYYYSLVGSGVCAEIERGEFNEIARHFAEWGAAHARKEDEK